MSDHEHDKTKGEDHENDKGIEVVVEKNYEDIRDIMEEIKTVERAKLIDIPVKEYLEPRKEQAVRVSQEPQLLSSTTVRASIPSPPPSTSSGQSDPDSEQSERSERTEVSVYNHWTVKNRKTVINWRDDLTQIGFAYDYVISKYRKREKKYSIWLFIISTVMTTVSLSQFNTSEEEDKVLSTIFKIGFAVLSFIATLLSGIQKINNYSKLIEDFRTYVNDLENFVTILSSELMLPDNLRKDALEFILLHRSTFQKMLSNNPDVDDVHYKEGIDQYLDYIDNIENRKYNRNKSQFRREDSIDMGVEMIGMSHHRDGKRIPVLHLG